MLLLREAMNEISVRSTGTVLPAMLHIFSIPRPRFFVETIYLVYINEEYTASQITWEEKRKIENNIFSFLILKVQNDFRD